MSNSITHEDVLLLQENGWIVFVDHNFVPTSIKSGETGCQISGKHTIAFTKDKLQELVEDAKETPSWDERIKLMEAEGFEVYCESPLELKDPDGHLITGECATFMLYSVTNP